MTAQENGFSPRIVAFCCRYCAYAAADLAGGLRLQYPPTIRIVELPCTGKLDAIHVLSAFEEGADGVMVAGCMPGDCHFIAGNTQASRRVTYVEGLLEQIGLEEERLRFYNMSSAMGNRFAEAAAEMDASIRELGPSSLRKQ
jgi:coenzyme F420-reducing hydrogenase delta subunit